MSCHARFGPMVEQVIVCGMRGLSLLGQPSLATMTRVFILIALIINQIK